MYELTKPHPTIYATGTQAGVIDAKQPSRIDAAQNLLDGNIGSLHEALGELERRLCGVLGPSKPAGVGEAAPTPGGVAGRIEGSARGVANAGERIADLINRLEL